MVRAEVHASTAQKMKAESEDLQRFKAKGAPVSLPKHSYWFDFWLFILFDVAIFLVMYFIIP